MAKHPKVDAAVAAAATAKRLEAKLIPRRNVATFALSCEREVLREAKGYDASGLEAGPLWRTTRGRSGSLIERAMKAGDILRMVKRRAQDAGVPCRSPAIASGPLGSRRICTAAVPTKPRR